MNRIAWHRLMRLGLAQLGLRPAEFWDLTPAELMVMAGLGEGAAVLGRSEFEALTARFPDGPRMRSTEGSDHGEP